MHIANNNSIMQKRIRMNQIIYKGKKEYKLHEVG